MQISEPNPIKISIALPVREGPESIAQSLICIDNQTIAGAIELFIITDKPELFARVAADHPHIGSIRILHGTPSINTGACRALAFREASAPFVANAEDHCHPEPGWAAGMLAAFDDKVAAVCPVLQNADRGKPVGTAEFYADFWFFTMVEPGTNLKDLPGRNCCYRRSVLLSLPASLEHYLEAEFNLHTDLRAHGWNLRLAPQAIAKHHNICNLATALRFHFNFGRLFVSSRSQLEAWSAPRIAIHAFAWPIIPVLKLWRMRRVFSRFSHDLHRADVLATLVLLFVAAALGEGFGAVAGPGDSAKAISESEFQHE